jgi:hypothetical protein
VVWREKAGGGREVIYFSPSCLNEIQQPLFE